MQIGSYQPDPTCSYEFKLFSQTHHIILGIKTDSFDIMTDWDHSHTKKGY